VNFEVIVQHDYTTLQV